MNLKKPRSNMPQPLMVNANLLYSPSDYAKKLCVSRRTIYNMVESGQIEPNRVYDCNGTTMILHQ
jgi:hypothetical protein